MASLAGLLKQRGFKVTGSDAAAYPPMSDFLASISIPVAQPYSEANLKPRPDMVGENFKSFHVLDPDGWDLQISNQTKETRE